MDSNVVFITHNDVVDTAEVIETTRMGERSKRRTGGFKKTEKINRVLKAYLKEKRAVEQEDSGREHRGVHLRPANSNEHIVVIDTAGLVQAEKEYKALPKGEQRLNINKDKLATAEWVILTTLAHEIGHVVELDVLDKVSSKTSKLKVIIGEEIVFQNLIINVLKCKNSKFDDDPEITAYIQVKDLNESNNEKVFIFNGWTFSSSPTLNPFDHPVFDLWLSSCKAI